MVVTASRLTFGLSAALALIVLTSPIARTQVTFRSGVDLVNVTATVTDGDGRFVSGLKQEDFVVLDDGKPQEIVSFTAQRVPVSLGIVLDVSGSMTPDKMGAARASIRRFTNDLLAADDEIFLAAFGTKTHLLQTWTTDRGTLARALDRTQVEYGTSIYDAIRSSLPVASTGDHSKKAILLVSDGDDRNSRTPLKQLQDLIRSSEIMVYALGVEGEDGISADKLRKITDDTGGRTEIVKGFRNLDEATARLASELNQQYLIGYTTPHQKDGKWHTIKLEVKKRGAKVRARAGYMADS